MYRNINLLVTFECAARHHSYSLAAGELCISQAAVSQQMRQLERDLGCRLFIRKNRQMLLTQQGQTLFDGAQQALKMINRTLNHIHTEEIAGELTISSTQAFTTLWLMPRLQRFSELHPEIQVRIVSSPGFDDLKHSHIDLAIRFGVDVEKHTPKSLACEYFGEDFVYPVCSARLHEKLAFTSAQDLLSTWLVTLENPGNYSWHHWFEGAGVDGWEEHEQWTRVSSTDMALNAVLSGHGITLAAIYLCRRQLETGELVIPFEQPHPNSVKRYFVYDPHSAKKARLQIFMQWLKTAMTSGGG
ncbi:LysR substrate-binding domain-containing protein [Photobacterium atrarenae]|uniref:LysR substrate-binding domain-containing protein n=1 Tax=Photobacterium atrarenae TaxID=865757 RepID=A0ABY5GD38_9GAMM|nr:LysR substrate-binding domain-containing protein [Photobacterium atrarenae]UTV26619.1 LysR substrate-binding domain-containing protein [Photobacterium atrarenae]